MARRQPYPTDLSDKESALIQPYVPEAKRGSRPAEYPKREILNGIFYLLRTGCAWRLLPHDLLRGALSIIIFEPGARMAPGT